MKCLAKNQIIPKNKIRFNENDFNLKLSRFDVFSDDDFKEVKKIESVTNHDVKAVEYFIKNELEKLDFPPEFREFTHFLCTSEDINNIAYSLLINQFKKDVYLPHIILKMKTKSKKISPKLI